MGATFVPRVGHEVLVEHINGDPDLPVIIGCAVNAWNMPGWMLPDNQSVSGLRSQSFGNSREANHLAFDDRNGQLQAQLSSDHGTSQLSLGFIRRLIGNRGRQDKRGTGFELRTDLWGALRAARGLLVSTYRREGAQGHVKDVSETVARLTQAREQHEDMAQLAQRHEAQPPDANQRDVTKAIKAQNDALRGDVKADSDDFPNSASRIWCWRVPRGLKPAQQAARTLRATKTSR